MKLGLALSGGGFRASFFHLGVLARMAEWGLLRHVEALSTVSGGSILGALYYVHLKRLLETKPDADIRDEDYVRIVEQGRAVFRPEREARADAARGPAHVSGLRRRSGGRGVPVEDPHRSRFVHGDRGLLPHAGQWLLHFVVRGLLPALGAGFVWLHLQIFDRLFLRLGRFERLR
ncbi:MAG: patatin-like phospholipase family protein [Candidatus Rokubacteria bacterium]|nr:patatin-like phospholipase family protein [Candidatus Rokubacteria bacterium]